MEPKGPPAVAAQLRRLRRSRRLTQRGLAQASGVAVGTIQAIELGERVPQFRTLAALAQALDVPLESLDPTAAATDPLAVFTREDLAVAHLLNHATPTLKDHIFKLLLETHLGNVARCRSRPPPPSSCPSPRCRSIAGSTR